LRFPFPLQEGRPRPGNSARNSSSVRMRANAGLKMTLQTAPIVGLCPLREWARNGERSGEGDGES
jgi:hypothetical protein